MGATSLEAVLRRDRMGSAIWPRLPKTESVSPQNKAIYQVEFRELAKPVPYVLCFEETEQAGTGGLIILETESQTGAGKRDRRRHGRPAQLKILWEEILDRLPRIGELSRPFEAGGVGLVAVVRAPSGQRVTTIVRGLGVGVAVGVVSVVSVPPLCPISHLVLSSF
jgi:hypothetical protein